MAYQEFHKLSCSYVSKPKWGDCALHEYTCSTEM